jgi:hypothetical protein
MDRDHAMSLLWRDTEYEQSNAVLSIDFTDTGSSNAQEWNATKGPIEGPSSAHTRVVFVKQKRQYYPKDSKNRIFLTRETWNHVLDQLMIPSLALECLHDNNGGCGSLFSHCSSDACQGPAQTHCAYHFWVRLGDSGNFEHFAYARHDFHTGRNLILVMGTDGDTLSGRLTSQFRGRPRVGIFAIFLALTSSWFRQVEARRWKLDYNVQKIESQTGHSAMRFKDSSPLPLEQLSLGQGITSTSSALQITITGALNMAKIFSFLSTQQKRYADLCLQTTDPPIQHDTQLEDAFSQYLSQTEAQSLQMQVLKIRVDAQWNLIHALIVQRESQVIRGIAFVTMVFLPAMFLAAFFGMVFFRLETEDSSKLAVSTDIWLFPICTIPLTVVLALLYGPETLLGRKFRSLVSGPKEVNPGNGGRHLR